MGPWTVALDDRPDNHNCMFLSFQPPSSSSQFAMQACFAHYYDNATINAAIPVPGICVRRHDAGILFRYTTFFYASKPLLCSG